MENGRYSLNDIQELTQITPQSIYRLMKSNKELKSLVEAHKIRAGNNVYYDSAVYEWFKERYQGQVKSVPADEIPSAIDYEAIIASKDEMIEELRRQIEQLKTDAENAKAIHEREKEELQKVINDKEAERVFFISENSKALAIISNQQQLLLSAPKRTIRERIKAIFTKDAR